MKSPYRNLAFQTIVGGVIMYLVMFVMIDRWSSFYNNLNTFYMALMMVAPMGVLMLVMMRQMYRNTGLNLALHAGFTLLFMLAFLGIRAQAGIGDAQFLRSMIPHHSGAILMCREAPLSDPEIVRLCGQIIRAQRAEIDQMERILARY